MTDTITFAILSLPELPMSKKTFTVLPTFFLGVSAVFLTVFQWNTSHGIVFGETTEAIATITPTETPSVTPFETVLPTQTPSATPSVTPPASPTSTASAIGNVSTTNPLSGALLFNDPDTNSANKQVQEWQSSRPADAAMIKKIADQPKAIWMGGWNSNIQGDTQNIMNKAGQAGAVPVFIAYNIPNRDCGSYSAGGSGNAQAYRDWINGMATGIGSSHAVVVLEPDALAHDCLQGDQKTERYELLKYAIQKLKSLGNTAVYLDAGHAAWVEAGQMSQRLRDAGIESTDGFALNVSNFETTDSSIAYGQQISGQVNGKHFIIDTSRNGNGPSPDKQWCNPAGRALGDKPTTSTNNSLVDGLLWLKYPGQSDGNCNGAPNAGEWHPEYALELAKNAKW